MASDSSTITRHEPMYGNENRTPPIPVKGTKYSQDILYNLKVYIIYKCTFKYSNKTELISQTKFDLSYKSFYMLDLVLKTTIVEKKQSQRETSGTNCKYT